MAAKLIQFGKTDAPIHHQFAVRADRSQVADRGSDWLIFGHITGWHFGGAASDAVDFTGLAWLLMLCPFRLKVCSQNLSVKQHRSFVVYRREAVFVPISHRVFVRTKQLGNFFHGVVAMNFDVAMVWVALAHDGYPPPLALA